MRYRLAVCGILAALVLNACGTQLEQIADSALPTAQVIVITATPEAPLPEAEPTATMADAVAPVSSGVSTLQAVQDRGVLRCGVNADLPGFGLYDAVRKRWSGFDVDFCKVIAAAVLGDPTKVEYIATTAAEGPNERLNAVRSGMVDVLIRNTTWTASRDGAGLMFAPTTFHDGQTFMVRSDSGIATIDDLAEKRICAGKGTTSLLNLTDDFAARDISFTLVEVESETIYAQYEAGSCDAVTSDSSQLSVQRVNLKQPDAHVVLGDRISREPLGPVVAEGDPQWFDIVSWAINATIYAEELRIDSTNVNQALATSTDPRVLRLLGVEGKIGAQFGLAPDFAYQVISQVGNYGEIYNANLGPDTTFAIDRGPNKAWNLGGGGVLASPPFR